MNGVVKNSNVKIISAKNSKDWNNVELTFEEECNTTDTKGNLQILSAKEAEVEFNKDYKQFLKILKKNKLKDKDCYKDVDRIIEIYNSNKKKLNDEVKEMFLLRIEKSIRNKFGK